VSAPPEALIVRPQPGPQEEFFRTAADIAIYGGAAGGGKTWGLVHEPLRHVDERGFGAVIFRRTSKQARNEGGLWDESSKVYPLFGAEPREQVLEWTFPSGAKVAFAHLQHEKNKLDWQGGQVAMLGFDELTHFTRSQFFYMLSRNRSTCGVRPYVRATCNPDADSWVAGFISWWIDEETGLPATGRAGVLRYMFRDGEAIAWGSSVEEVCDLCPAVVKAAEKLGVEPATLVKSVTFIPAKVEDNPELLRRDPGYMANLMAQDMVDRKRLLEGNWKVRRESGTMFRREWLQLVEQRAPDNARRVRFWDSAGTEDDGGNDPDWTVGVLMALHDGRVTVEDVVRGRWSPGRVEEIVEQTTRLDGHRVAQRMEQEPGSSGKAVVDRFARAVLAGYDFKGIPSTGDKATRARPLSAAAYNGLMQVLIAPWTADYVSEHAAFPSKDVHDDQVDASSGAFNCLHGDGAYSLAGMVTM
jgi:predicted phage terminase large subunit-like protein